MSKGIQMGYLIPWAMSDVQPSRLTTLADMTPEQKEIAIRDGRRWAEMGLATRDHCDRCPKYYNEPSPNCVNRLEHVAHPDACHVCHKPELIQVRQVSQCRKCDLPVCNDCAEVDYGSGDDGRGISQWDCRPCLWVADMARKQNKRTEEILTTLNAGANQSVRDVVESLDAKPAAKKEAA